SVFILEYYLLGPAVLIHDYALDFLIDLDRGVFAVVLVLSNLAAQEDLLFLLPERYRSKRRHSELANHLSRKLGRLLDVVGSAGSHVVEEYLLGDAAAHHDGDLPFEVVPSVRIAVSLGQLHCHAQRHATRYDRYFVDRIGIGYLDSHQGMA